MDSVIIQVVEMKLVDRPKDPSRGRIDPEKIRELAESIREVGLQQPVLLRPLDGRYEVVAGDRRYLAHKLLGTDGISSIVKEMTDEEVIVLRATENLQREDLTPMEEAREYGKMRKDLAYSNEKIARKMGRSYQTIKKYLDLLDLDPEFQDAIDQRKLGVAAAHALIQIDDREFRNFYLKSAVENGVTEAVAKLWVEEYRRTKEGRQYQGEGTGGGVNPAEPERAIFSTCSFCNGPVNVKEVRYMPSCPECIKEMLKR